MKVKPNKNLSCLNGFISNKKHGWGSSLWHFYTVRSLLTTHTTLYDAYTQETRQLDAEPFHSTRRVINSPWAGFIRDCIRTGELLESPVNDLERCRNVVFSMNFPQRRMKSSAWSTAEWSCFCLWNIVKMILNKTQGTHWKKTWSEIIW